MKEGKEGTIFVQIASYRDPQLLPTLKDCIEKSKYPENLVFSIMWQHSIEDTWDNLDEYIDDDRFKIIDTDYKLSKGTCWARSVLQQNYDGEQYTLQLDSHHRFLQDWDGELITMYNNLKSKGVDKPLLTSYASSFDPENDPDGRINIPWRMNFDRYTPEGYIFFIPSSIDEYQELTGPIPSRFYSAHFAFTSGNFVKEVPHDPDFYFHGEEISISARAYTWGYDLYAPHKVVIWHEYTRNNKKKHWDDNSDWPAKNDSSHKKNRQLFGMDGETRDIGFGIYDFGSVRPLSEYEKFAGVSFKTRGVQQYTLDHKDPPNPLIENKDDYKSSFLYVFKHCIDIYKPNLKESDYDFWVVSFEMLDGTVVNRRDASQDEINTLMSGSGDWIQLWREYTGKKPDKWVVWPHSISKGWCDRMETIL